MARKMNAKRANRPNPRADRNNHPFDENVFDFPNSRTKRSRQRNQDPRSNGPAEEPEVKSKKVVLTPRTLNQETYIETLLDENKTIVFAMGPAGTGKTMLATQFAISLLQQGLIKKIVITRPTVAVDSDVGFLPGDLLSKLAPWLVPIIEVFKEHYSVKQVEDMLKAEVIEAVSIGMVRGRNFKNAVVIADEMQNATPSQMKTLLTRVAEGSRMVITGDLKQFDRGFAENGLKDFVARVEQNRSEMIAVCHFSSVDIQRHPAVAEVLRIYGEE